MANKYRKPTNNTGKNKKKGFNYLDVIFISIIAATIIVMSIVLIWKNGCFDRVGKNNTPISFPDPGDSNFASDTTWESGLSD